MPSRRVLTPWRTGAADHPLAERTGRSLVVKTTASPWPTVVEVPRDWARWPLLHGEKLATQVVDPRAVEDDGHLQREHELAIEVAVQGVPIARPVAQQQRRGLVLAGGVAGVEPLLEGVGPRGRAAEAPRPLPGDRQQPRVQRLPQQLDRLGQRAGKVAVLARAKPVPCHVDGGPPQGRVLVAGGDCPAVAGVEHHPGVGHPRLVERLGDRRPVEAVDGVHRASRSSSARLASGPPT